MIKIDGKELASGVLDSLKSKVSPASNNILAFVLIGNDSASRMFVERKLNITRDVLPIPTMLIVLPATFDEEEAIRIIRNLARDESVRGIVVQLPLPSGMNRERVISEIPKEKDVDNLRGDGSVTAPAVKATEEIISAAGFDLSSSKVAVIGAGYLTGRPIFERLQTLAKEIYLIDKNDDRRPVGEADIVISGVGQNGVIKASELKEGVLVIDFGTSFNEEGRIVGDLLIDKEIAGFYTPTPGGTGPLLIAKLFENYYELLSKRIS